MLQRIVKDCTDLLSVMTHYFNAERIFSLMQPHVVEERGSFYLTQFPVH